MRHGARHVRWVVGVVFLAWLPSSGSGIAQLSAVMIAHAGRAVAPGELIVLIVTSDRPLRQVQGTAFGRSVPLYESETPRAWRGLVGIDLAVKPGRYEVMVSGRAGAVAISRTHTLAVQPVQFRTRRLTVPREYVTPPESARARIEQEAKRVGAIMATVTPERLWQEAFRQPVPGLMISPFGTLSVLNGTPRSRHAGADFRAAEGTPVLAPAAGRVALTGDLYFSGLTVIIDHGLGLVSLLAHLSKIRVGEGDFVASGDEVGYAGSTGRVTGPHLHWTVRVGGARVDPLSLLAILGPGSEHGR